MTPQSPSEVRRVAFVSLGCPKNLVDSERMLGLLREDGLELVSDHAAADAIVINTCGFLEASRLESLEVIREALDRKRAGDLRRVVVAGCLVQRHRARLLDWAPEIDSMIGVFDRDRVVDAVRGAAPSRDGLDATQSPKYWIAGNALQAAKERGRDVAGLTVNGQDGKGIGYFEEDAGRVRLTPRHWAYLRISEGCNQRCAFCTIPSIRGKMRSKPRARILDEARSLLAEGAFELNLIGQDTTSWGLDIGDDGGLPGLLADLNTLADEFGGAWLRLMYAYPSTFGDDAIDALASLPNVVKYLDIPLQHITDPMLERMRRHVTREQTETLLAKLRERVPGIAIRTTFITGFPGETEEDHEALVEFVRDARFEAMGVFQYSREEGTPAGTMDLDPALRVPDEVKAQREAELMLAQQENAFADAAWQAEQGAVLDVLIEGAAGDPGVPAAPQAELAAGEVLHSGRAYHQAPQIDSMTAVVSKTRHAPGELVRCVVVASDGYDLVARPEQELRDAAEGRIGLPVVG